MKGLKPEDVSSKEVEMAYTKSTLGLKKFYEGLNNLDMTDMETIDLAKPFGIYSSNIRLKLHERLNIIERETV